MSTDKRGLVISVPIQISETGVSGSGPLDTQELRSALLLWDKVDFPANNLIAVGGGADEAFLASAGILQRTRINVQGDIAKAFLAAHVGAYKLLDDAEPGVWSLGRGKNSVAFDKSELEDDRGILVQLHDAIPVPDKDVALQDILEFREKRRAELLALRHHLDCTYQRIIAAGDGELALNSEVAALDRAIAAYIKASKQTSFPFKAVSLDANLNVVPAATAAIAAYQTGLSLTQALLIGGASLAAGLRIGPGISLKGRSSIATPFQYISSFNQQLFAL